jgi:hypothetical protein
MSPTMTINTPWPLGHIFGSPSLPPQQRYSEDENNNIVLLLCAVPSYSAAPSTTEALRCFFGFPLHARGERERVEKKKRLHLHSTINIALVRTSKKKKRPSPQLPPSSALRHLFQLFSVLLLSQAAPLRRWLTLPAVSH